MMTLEGLIEHNVHNELPSLDDILASIRQMIMDSFRIAKKTVGAMLVTLMLGSMPMSAHASVEMTSIPAEIVVDNQGASPVFTEVEDAYPQHYRISCRIKELAGLEEGWDQAGGLKPNAEAIKNAGKFADLLSEEVLKCCSLFPAADSGVYLQGNFKKGSMIVSFTKNSLTYVLKGDNIDKKAASSVPLVKETVRQLDGLIIANLLA